MTNHLVHAYFCVLYFSLDIDVNCIPADVDDLGLLVVIPAHSPLVTVLMLIPVEVTSTAYSLASEIQRYLFALSHCQSATVSAPHDHGEATSRYWGYEHSH